MKVYYQCEKCGKRFLDEDEANACEVKHEEERVRKERLEKDKDARCNEIKSLIQAYYRDYSEMPSVTISGTFSDKSDSLAKTLFDYLFRF